MEEFEEWAVVSSFGAVVVLVAIAVVTAAAARAGFDGLMERTHWEQFFPENEHAPCALTLMKFWFEASRLRL